MATIPFSILDLAPVAEGSDAGEALRRSLDLAQHAERWGYARYWLAEHHNMPGIASAATAVAIGYIAAGTHSIRIGSGGVMLPNHAPLVVAEQFGTLAALYPGRIELGLGRAPGTDQATAHALRRDLATNADNFPEDVIELQGYFEPVKPGQRIQAVPGAGLRVPLYLLGSSLFSAQLAGVLGLPFAFASHFAPELLTQALAKYRQRFRPSRQLEQPYAIGAVNVYAADSEAEARRQFSSIQQAFIALRRGTPGQLPPPVEAIEQVGTTAERAGMNQALKHSFVGTPEQVEEGLRGYLAATGVDELMLTGHFFDHAARLRSFELAAQVRERIAAG